MANNEQNVYSNNLAIINVLAALIKNPLLFADNNYHFDINDFPEQFHRIVFGAIDHLAHQGMQKIDYIDINEFLKQYPAQYQVFSQNNGVAYIQNCLAAFDEKKFNYYYKTLKKYSLLRLFQSQGFDVTSILDPSIVDPKKIAEQQDAFDQMTANDIILFFETKIIQAKENFGNSDDLVQNHMGDDIIGLIDELKRTPEMGMSLLSAKLTTVYRGARKGCVYMESAPSGLGKALPNSTVIPTPNGWKKVGDIKPGDYVFDAFGKPTRVVEIYPQGLKEVYQITLKDGRTAKCCNEHLWSFNTAGQKTENRLNRKFITKTLQEIIDQYPLQNADQSFNVLLPQNKSVRYNSHEHFIHPYVMGAFLGDGSFRDTEKNHAIEFSSADKEIIENIELLTGWNGKKNEGHNYTWYFEYPEDQWFRHPVSHTWKKNVWIKDFLKEHEDLYNTNSKTKFIPREYLEDSFDNRIELLSGLLDTDGRVDCKGRISYFTISPQLKNDVIELVRSVGLTATVTEDSHKDTNTCYVIHISGDPEVKKLLFKLSRKHNTLMNWYNTKAARRNTHKYFDNPIVKIEKLGYSEEMTCFWVDNDEHLFLTENFIVTHNTRRAVGEACNVAIPERYDTDKKQWVKTGFAEHALLIETELELKEIQTIVLAFVSGVPETHILDGKYVDDEEERVYKAGELVLESHLYMAAITNYDMDDIINVIKKYNQIYNCDYIYYDYLSETLKIMAEGTRRTKMPLRTDQVLLSMITQLKDCAKQLNIFIWTATQLSGDYKNAKELDAGFLRSAKSLSDKLDVGAILMPVREMDQPAIDAYCAKGFETVPNFVIHVYKIRRGSYQNIKVFIYFDRSTGRVTDTFVTDRNGELLPIADTNIEIILDQTKEEKIENTSLVGFDF